METYIELNKLTNRVREVRLRSGTFADEKVLGSISRVFLSGGSITVKTAEYPDESVSFVIEKRVDCDGEQV